MCIFASVMSYYFAYIKHYFLANSRHGTHSPFVYKLADEAIYVKASTFVGNLAFSSAVPQAYHALLTRILLHLGYTTLMDFDAAFDPAAQAAVYVESAGIVDMPALVARLDHTVVVVGGLYKSKQALAQWKSLQQHPDVTVTIDLFFFGLLFKRAGQHKESFRLRYPAGFIPIKP